jgi:O-antigen/teichoic acid export membrane protein
VDDLVSGTLYPAICAVKDRRDLLQESFVKSNRLALLWAMPFGVGLALFCSDLVRYGIGEKWRAAVGLLQITGIVAAIGHLGFNWDDYFRARSDTRPVAVAAVAATVTFLAIGIPLILTLGLPGLALATGIQAVVHLFFRAFYLTRFFEGFAFVRHAARAILPTVPGAAFVLVMHLVTTGPGTLGRALVELAAYVLITIVATWRLEGGLVREAAGYLIAARGRAVPTPS